jgi:hypothetical protein
LSGLFFKKENQNNIVLLKKKQKLMGCNRVFDWVLPGQPDHQVNSPGFFFT